ncbi:MAG: DinB family protein [Acidobacteria bacterium]|nr:DinB family protein [Acidobacteriota bacterium]
METEDNSISRAYFVGAAAYLLRETFEGSPAGEGSAYLDQGVGVFPTLSSISAAAASKEFHGTTVAAQTEHAKFYLDRLCEFINGRTEVVKWDQSWLIETVDEEEWKALLIAVRKTYEDSLRCLAEDRTWNESQVGMAMGMIAHTAYHLGAVRQIIKSTQ